MIGVLSRRWKDVRPTPTRSDDGDVIGRVRSLERRWVAALFLIMVALVGPDPSGRVGDGTEYLVMAHGIAFERHVSYGRNELANAEAWRNEVGHGFEEGPIDFPTLANQTRGSQEFPHFWMYPLAASPFSAIAELIGIPPSWGFILLNMLLLGAVGIVGQRALGRWPTVFLLASPVLWWIDKVHTEVWTFSLLSLGMLWFRRHPGPGMVAVAFASTQNLPIAATLPVYILIAAVAGYLPLRRGRSWGWIIAALVIAALHPAYYMWRIGVYTPQILNGGTQDGVWFGWTKLLAPLLDLNIGVLPHYPLLFVLLTAAGFAAVRHRADMRSSTPALAFAVSAFAVFLFAFAKTGNVNSGGTFGMSRYGVWLLPLFIPVIEIVSRLRPAPRVTPIAVTVFAAFALFAYHPSQPENYLQETALARFIWTRAPSLSNPHPEVFVERISQQEGNYMSAALPNCSKALIVEGDVPEGCPIDGGDIPYRCQRPRASCYANRTGDQYAFEEAQLR